MQPFIDGVCLGASSSGRWFRALWVAFELSVTVVAGGLGVLGLTDPYVTLLFFLSLLLSGFGPVLSRVFFLNRALLAVSRPSLASFVVLFFSAAPVFLFLVWVGLLVGNYNLLFDGRNGFQTAGNILAFCLVCLETLVTCGAAAFVLILWVLGRTEPSRPREEARRKTSSTHPLERLWASLNFEPSCATAATAKIILTMLPGRQKGAWFRSLEDDLEALEEAGVTRVFRLVRDNELPCEVSEFNELASSCGISISSYPLADKLIPGDMLDYRSKLIVPLFAELMRGQTCAVNCNGGMGRTGLTVLLVLVEGGLSPQRALRLLRAERPHALRNPLQLLFARSYYAAFKHQLLFHSAEEASLPVTSSGCVDSSE